MDRYGPLKRRQCIRNRSLDLGRYALALGKAGIIYGFMKGSYNTR